VHSSPNLHGSEKTWLPCALHGILDITQQFHSCLTLATLWTGSCGQKLGDAMISLLGNDANSLAGNSTVCSSVGH